MRFATALDFTELSFFFSWDYASVNASIIPGTHKRGAESADRNRRLDPMSAY